MLQPPLPRMGGAACPQLPFALCPRLWDERHVPMHDADDVAIWGSGLGRREHWPRWLLVLAAGVGLLGMSGAVPGSRSALVRLLVAAAVGWLVGEYLALEVVPGQFILQVRLDVCFFEDLAVLNSIQELVSFKSCCTVLVILAEQLRILYSFC